MTGKNAGVAKLIQEGNTFAIYIHCFAHRLNLCVAGSCDQQVIKNMMDKVRCVSEFFGYPKRAELLRTNVEEFTSKERRNTLLDVCKTRWISRIDGLDRFEEMYEVVMLTLQAVRDNVGGHWNDDSRNLAASLFSSCSEFSFVISLVVAKYFLYFLLLLTSGLQERELDIKKAYQNIEFVKKSLRSSRAALDKIHKDLYERAETLADVVVPSEPRTCRNRQMNRENHDSPTATDDFRVSLTTPFVDHIINEIDTRFGSAPVTVVKGFSIIPDLFLNQKEDDWKEDFIEFAATYKRDIPSPISISPKLLMWETYWRKGYKGSIPSSIAETLKKTFPMRASFPNIYATLRLLATIPVTSCECERSISVLRRLKTYLRNTMGEGRLNALSLMSIHRDIPTDFHEVIARFVRKHPRRMELVNILDV